MARFVFISLYDEYALGIRSLVATLKKAGHFAALLCFKSYNQTPLSLVKEHYEGMHIQVHPSGDYVNAYSPPATSLEHDLLLNRLKILNPDLVGIGLTSSQKLTGQRITALIRKNLGLPVIWGGSHPTSDPELCMEYVDFLCRGEAEDVLLDMAARLDSSQDFSDVPNLWTRQPDGAIVKNPVRPLRKDLDSLPFADYSKESIFFIDQNELRTGVPFPQSRLNDCYMILMARGCPFACSYCYESYLKELYKGQKTVRERSLDHVLQELKQIKEQMGHFYLEIVDDVFTLNESRVAEFCRRYHEEINEPFWCHTHPRCCQENVIRHIAASPNFGYIIMGIEAVSRNICQNVFHRDQTPEMILKAAGILNKYHMQVNYDLITNIPGETEQDLRENLDLLRSLPKPFRIRISKLAIFPNYRIETESKGKAQQISDARYGLWHSLFFLAQDIDMTDTELDALLANPIFEDHPEILQKINALFENRWDELTALKVKNHILSVDREAALKKEEDLKGDLARLKGRKGFKQFVWLHDQAESAKKRVKNLF